MDLGIFSILKQDDFFGISEELDIAKGKNELTFNLKEVIKQKERASYER